MQIETLAQAGAYLDGFVNLERRADFDYQRLGIDRVRGLLARMGNPERGLPCIHIAGSKGKGSTAWLTECLLRAAALRVGTYTSPHLECWSERFRIDGEPVGEKDLVALLQELRPILEAARADPELRPSFFDVSTALALALFRRLRVDVAVIEVGLGGRIDSTNVVESRVSLITSIELEHTEKLGHSLEAIAREKAGILREGVAAFHGPLDAEAMGAVWASAVAMNTPIEQSSGRVIEASISGQRVRLDDGREVSVGVLGEHQAHNVALAIRAAESFLERPLASAELASLRECRVPARLEWIGGRVVVDCAHTPESVGALRRCVERLAPSRPWVVVTAISRDKDAAEILQRIAPVTRALIACRAERVRSLDPSELEALAWASGIEEVSSCEEPVRALDRACALARSEDMIIVMGSVYLTGALRRSLLDRFGGTG